MLTAAPPLPTEAGVAAVVCGYDPSCENAFGALRRARQTRNKNHNSAIYAQSEAERILNRPFPALPRQRHILCVSTHHFAHHANIMA